VRRDPGEARTLGLWTAGWLAALLLAGLLWLGDLRLQWPVLLVPALWALVALRRGRGGRADDGDDGRSFWDEPDDRRRLPDGHRTDTVERPAVRGDGDRFSRRRREPWG
jgi:hypothetical protein